MAVIKKMMKAWKKKINRGKTEGSNGSKKFSRNRSDIKRRRSATSANNRNLISCLKKSVCDTDGSISDAKKSDTDSGGVSRASSTLDSIAGRTVTTCGCSSKSKKVRFETVEIREYERTASDNPCCTSGPPIGIGWNHGETHSVKVNDYEQSRGDRNYPSGFVLTRSEREALLLEWDTDSRTIIASTRAAMKTKFQRKQTVVNLTKFSKFEEAVETTSRRLKKALLPRRRFNDEADISPEQKTSQILDHSHSKGKNTVSTSSAGGDHKLKIHVTEPDDGIIENLIKNTFEFPTVGVCQGGDDNDSIDDGFTLGGTTLGNTSTHSPSIAEMEKFYRELELEMFGEELELPSMIGQTLEVPLGFERKSQCANSSISDGLIQDEIRSTGNSYHTNPQTAYMERNTSGISLDRSQSRSCDYSTLGNSHDSTYIYSIPNNSNRDRINEHQPVKNQFFHTPLTQDTSQHLATRYEQAHSKVHNPHFYYSDSIHSPTSYATTYNQRMPFIQNGLDSPRTQYHGGNYEPSYSQRNNYRHRRNRSFDSSCNMTQIESNLSYSSSSNQMRQYALTQLEIPSLSPSTSLDPKEHSLRRSESDGRYAKRSQSSRHARFDGPKVRHTPLHGHLSASEWIDGSDHEPFYRNKGTVTITESDS